MAGKKSKKKKDDELGPEIMDSGGNLEDLDFSLDIDINAPLPNTRDLTRDVMKTLNETVGDARELEAGNKLWQQASEPLKRIQAKTAASDMAQTAEEKPVPEDQNTSQMILPDDSDTVKARKLREALGLGAQATDQLPPHEERKLGRDAVTAISLLSNYAKRYPIENTLVTETIESLLESIRPILAVYGNAMITVLNESIYVDDRIVELDNYGEKDFVQEMLRRRIRRIVFRSEVTRDDVRELAKLFTSRPDEMVAGGGAAFLLGETGVEQIRIVESQYIAGSANEADNTTLDQKLSEAGLETEEVISAINGDPRSPRLISDELKLLYEALKAPGLLAILLMRVARETVNQNDTTNLIKLNLYREYPDIQMPEGAAVSYEIIQMTCRLRYLLAMSSPVDLDQATLVIRQGMDALPQDTRKNLLQFSFWLREYRQQEIDGRLFEFRPDEYADLIYENWKDRGHWPDRFTFFSKTQAERIANALEARLLIAVEMDSDPAKVKMLANKVSERLQLPMTSPLRSDEDRTHGHSGDFKLWQQDALKLALANRLESFSSDLTEGYTHILILLMMATTKTNHAGKFAERLAIIIEARLSAGKFDDVMYLLAAARHEDINLEKQEILRDKLENVLVSNAQIVPYLFLKMIQGDHAALKAMNLCTEISGEGFLAQVVAMGIAEKHVTGGTLSPEARRLLTSYLDKHATQLLPILATTLQKGDSHTRIGLLALLGYFQNDNVRDMAVVLLKDKNKDVQVAAILGLRQTQSSDIRQRLVSAASGEKDIGGLPGRCAALYVLGHLRMPELLPIATEILESAMDERKRRKASKDLVSFAAYGLHQMMSPQAFSLLKKMMKLLEPIEEEQEGISKVMGKLFKRK